MKVTTYKVFPSTIEDINNGWIWVSEPKLPLRSMAIVRNTKGNKSINCEILYIDDKYRKYYSSGINRKSITSTKSPIIVINEWYRNKLGIEDIRIKYEIEIKETNNIIHYIRACTNHPQAIIKIATWLAISSIGIGGLGIILSIIGIIISLCNKTVK